MSETTERIKRLKNDLEQSGAFETIKEMALPYFQNRRFQYASPDVMALGIEELLTELKKLREQNKTAEAKAEAFDRIMKWVGSEDNGYDVAAWGRDVDSFVIERLAELRDCRAAEAVQDEIAQEVVAAAPESGPAHVDCRADWCLWVNTKYAATCPYRQQSEPAPKVFPHWTDSYIVPESQAHLVDENTLLVKSNDPAPAINRGAQYCASCNDAVLQELLARDIEHDRAYEGIKLPTPLSEAVSTLQNALRQDEELYFTYQSNLAMSFYDEYSSGADGSPSVHEMCNAAAKRFLTLFLAEPAPEPPAQTFRVRITPTKVNEGMIFAVSDHDAEYYLVRDTGTLIHKTDCEIIPEPDTFRVRITKRDERTPLLWSNTEINSVFTVRPWPDSAWQNRYEVVGGKYAGNGVLKALCEIVDESAPVDDYPPPAATRAVGLNTVIPPVPRIVRCVEPHKGYQVITRSGSSLHLDDQSYEAINEMTGGTLLVYKK